MQYVGTRYLFLYALLFAACVGVLLAPWPEPALVAPRLDDGSAASRPANNDSFRSVLRPAAFVGAVTLFLNIVCTGFGCHSALRWAISITVPTAVLVVGLLITGDSQYVSPAAFAILSVLAFAVGTAVVSGLVKLAPPWVVRDKTHDRR
jgi:hypothetical protein